MSGVDRSSSSLTLEELSERTGVPVASLRRWQRHHDFPRARTIRRGPARFDVADLEAVRGVAQRVAGGARLETAVAEARDEELARWAPGSPSVFGRVRQTWGHLPRQRMRKAPLYALSRAIEQEFCRRATRPVLVGAFQHERHWRGSRRRWDELARGAEAAFVLAGFDDSGATRTAVPGRAVQVHLGAAAPMRQEWVVLCDAPDLPIALSAVELPSQVGAPDRDRLFEAVWTADPLVVRDLALVCARVAVDGGAPGAQAAADRLASSPLGREPAQSVVTGLLDSVIRHLDRHAIVHPEAG